MDIYQSLLPHLHCKEFLEDLVIGDDSWVLYDNATQHAVWIPRGDEPPAVPKPDHHSHRFLLCCWWNARGMLYWELLSQGTTVTASTYTHQLKKLAQTTRENQPRSENVHPFHDNDRPHVAKETQQTLVNLGWETVSHLLYSPDLALSNDTLFHPLKQFAKHQDPKLPLSGFSDSQLPEF